MFVRLYTGDDGQSCFEDIKPEMVSMGDSSATPATGISFRNSLPGEFLDWHPAPRRQYIINLEGEVEIGVGDGTIRRFGPGDVMLAEDLTGQGHTTRCVGDVPRISAAIPLA